MGEVKLEIDEMNVPKDTYNSAYIIHFMLGTGTLLPWNALITAVDYFGYLYPEDHVDKAFSVAYMGSTLPVLVLLMSWSSWSGRPSVRLRVNLGLVLFVLSLVLVPLMDWTSTHDSRGSSRAYTITVGAVAVCGLADALVAGSLIGSAGELPNRYMQAVFAGTACSGVLLSAMRIITKASLPYTSQGLRLSAHLYFILSALLLLSCIICYNFLDKLPVIKHHRHPTPQAKENTPSTSLEEAPVILYNTHEPKSKPKFWQVCKRIKCLSFGILIVYIVTLSIFPGYITENARSEFLKDWYPILLITTYNVADLVGKCLTAAYIVRSTNKVIGACILRLLFYPVFRACVHGPKLFRREVFVVFFTGGLGVSNGYLTSVLMILAPKSLAAAETEAAGVVMALFLGLGLVCGSVLGWFWVF